MAIEKSTTKKTETQKKPKTKLAKSKKPASKKGVSKVAAKKKAVAKKTVAAEKKEAEAKLVKRYYEAVGRRKNATARVRLFTCRPFESEDGRITVNGKPYTDYFTTLELRQAASDALRKMKSLNRFEVTAVVKGGGIRGQAEAVRHGLARTLVKFNADFGKKLKRAGFLRRDSRKVERKKPGLRKARRAPQWRKR